MTFDFQQIIDSIIDAVTEFVSLTIPITLPNEVEYDLYWWIPVISIAFFFMFIVSIKNK